MAQDKFSVVYENYGYGAEEGEGGGRGGVGTLEAQEVEECL